MSTTRLINHPGVQISEKDLSEYAVTSTGSTFLVMGYSDGGEEYDPVQPTTIGEFVTSFGEPTNEAERYFYYAVKNILSNNGSVVAAKLPYNNVIADNYRLLVYQ